MKSFFFKQQKDQNKEQKDLFNKLFLFDNIKNDEDIDDTSLYLKRKLMTLPEFSKDILSIQVILAFYLFNAKLSKSKENIKPDEIKLENLKNDIIKLLKFHDAFRYFIYNNHIDDKTLLKVIPYMKYEYIPKDTYFSKEGEISTKMYFIIKGKVSFRKAINSLRSSNLLQEEKYSLTDNDNFGQYDIIFERRRKLSFYTSENCHLISIEREFFRKFLEEKITKGDSEKKTFLTRFIKKNMTMAAYKIDNIILNTKMLFFRKGDIVYKEGDITKSIYLIYKGEAKLIKKIKNGEFNLIGKLNESILNLQKKAKCIDYIELIKKDYDDENTKNKNNQNYNYNMKYLKTKKIKVKEGKFPVVLDLLLEKPIYHDIEILGRGGLGGLEITTGILKSKYTMVTNSDYTTIFQLELKNFEEHLTEFMLNLLPIFYKNEKIIHSRIKQIKYIDQKIIPLNCQKFKVNNKENKKNLILNQFENNTAFEKEIQKINNKFDTNEGGFIKMNDFNMSLNKQKNLLKEQLKDNKIKDIKVDYYLMQRKEKEKSKLKYTGVKMISKSNTINIDNLSNYNHKTNTLITSKSVYKHHLDHGFLSQRKKNEENELTISNSRKRKFLNSNYSNIKRINAIKKKLKKNMSYREITKKNLEIFDKIIENEKERKSFFKIELFNPQVVKTESNERSQRRKTSEYDIKKDSNLLKEVIIYKNNNKNKDNNHLEFKTINNEKNYFIINENDNKYKYRTMSAKNKITKDQYNRVLLNELNINKRNNGSDNEDDNIIINNNFLRRLFEKNMIKKKKRNLTIKNDFNRNYETKRMIYYNTGMYDMPLVSHFI